MSDHDTHAALRAQVIQERNAAMRAMDDVITDVANTLQEARAEVARGWADILAAVDALPAPPPEPEPEPEPEPPVDPGPALPAGRPYVRPSEVGFLGQESSLVSTSGNLVINQPGAVIEGRLIRGTVTVNADDVTIRDSVIRVRTGGIIVRSNGKNLFLENVTIDGQGNGLPAVAYSNFKMYRCLVHNVAEGPRLGGNSAIIESAVEKLVQVGSNHTDAVQSLGGSSILIEASYLDLGPSVGNAAFQFGEEDRALNAVVARTYLNGGNYTVNGRGGGTRGATVRFVDPYFGPDHRYGRVSVGDRVTWEYTSEWSDEWGARHR